MKSEISLQLVVPSQIQKKDRLGQTLSSSRGFTSLVVGSRLRKLKDGGLKNG